MYPCRFKEGTKEYREYWRGMNAGNDWYAREMQCLTPVGLADNSNRLHETMRPYLTGLNDEESP